jgi:hypothetical protein
LEKEKSNFINKSIEEWENFLIEVEHNVEYKLHWVADAKENKAKTLLAFRTEKDNTTFNIFRLLLNNLFGENWGQVGSSSVKYMIPGLKFKCLTIPYDSKSDGEYFYATHIWKGDSSKEHNTTVNSAFDIKWDEIPTMNDINVRQSSNFDDFCTPECWDTITPFGGNNGGEITNVDLSDYATKEYADSSAYKSNVQYSKNTIVKSTSSDFGVNISKNYTNANREKITDPNEAIGDYFELNVVPASFNSGLNDFTNKTNLTTGYDVRNYV